MMTQQDCADKAAMCEGRATECGDADHSAHWLEMATVWRELAGDTNAQATIARLMQRVRAPSQSDRVEQVDSVA